jgi:S-adenosylmethionine/arginine decarboxylase-like enzyme
MRGVLCRKFGIERRILVKKFRATSRDKAYIQSDLAVMKIGTICGGTSAQKLNTRPYAYKQIVATLHGCQSDLLDDKLLLSTTLTAIRNANMHLARTKTTNPLVYKVGDDIMGGGVSVNALITTSHLTVHTSKLYRTTEFDCATCGYASNPLAALATFRRILKPTHITIHYGSDEIQDQITSAPTIKG